ncbi:hypothetical protein GGI12_005950, partial [Dipsacomyces acuminosporus]
IPQQKPKGINSPVVASPLSRNSIHAAENSTEPEDAGNEGSSQDTGAQLAKDGQLLRPVPASRSGKNIFPQLSRSSSQSQSIEEGRIYRIRSTDSSASATSETHRRAVAQRLSYQFGEDYASELAIHAANTPSPPDKNIARSQSYFVNDTRTPTLQRQRTALSTVDWSDSNSLSSRNNSEQRFSPPPPHPSGGATRGRQGSTLSLDSPLTMMSSFQVRRRVSSGLARNPSAGASSRSSVSMASDFMRSWVNSASNIDSVEASSSQRNNVPAMDSSGGAGELGRDSDGVAYQQGWITPSSQQGYFDSSLLNWRFANEGSTIRTQSSTSSTAQEPRHGSSPGIPFNMDIKRTSNSTPPRSSLAGVASSDTTLHKYHEIAEYEPSSVASSASNTWSASGTPPPPPLLGTTSSSSGMHGSQIARPR